jgi:hypothetical protein
MVISNNSPKDIMKDYVEVSLYIKVEVLEVIMMRMSSLK